MTSPGGTEPGEPEAGPGTRAAAEAARERPGERLQVNLDDLDEDGDRDTGQADSLAADDDAAVAGPPETEKAERSVDRP